MLRFRLFGIPITVQPWHWLILAFVGGALYIDDRSDVRNVLLAMAAGFASILLHELGHALTGRKFGAPRPEIILHGLGGVAMFPDARFTRSQHIWVTVMGPAVQLALGIAAFVLFRSGAIPNEPLLILVFWLMWFSIAWAVLNIFPIYPLDGGQILFHALGPSRRILTLRISMFTAVALAAALFLLTQRFLFPLLLGFMAWENYQMLKRGAYY